MWRCMVCACFVLAVFPRLVLAEDTGIDIKLGTLGAGIEVAHAFNPSFALRLGYNGWNYSRTGTRDNIQYDEKLRLSTAALLGEWYPFQGVFRFDLGLMYNGNKFDLTAKPSGNQTYTINNTTYTAAQVGSVTGKVDFRKTAPYFGIGWGRAAGTGFSFLADLGVLFQRAPRSTLTVICGTGVNCSTLQSDANAEQARLDDSLHKFRYYPVASIGIGYRF